MERSYPKELAQRVRASWPADARPLPEGLEAILDVAYHASFLRDEERPVTCRVMVLPHDALPPDRGPPSGLLVLPFESPRAFDEDELRRLSPAAEVHRALIGVEDTGGAFVTWGIVQSGPRWLQAARGGRAKEPPIPLCLVVRVVRPGHVIVACGSRYVAELRGGRLSDFALDVFQSRWLPDLFRDARRATVSDHVGTCPAPLDESAAVAMSQYVAQQMIKRVVATMRGTHHGGTVLCGPAGCFGDGLLQTKYVFHEGPARRRFRALSLSILEAVAERARATGRPAEPELYRVDTDQGLAELDESLFEMSHLVAALANVDGAVVLTKRFELLGFGAEIAGNLPQVTEVRRALDLEADAFALEVVDAMGTRHRSAYRFCAAEPQSLAIVVSQDGGVRFVTQHRGALTYWDHGPGDA